MPGSATRQFDRRQNRPATQIQTICIVDPTVADYQGWDLLAQAKGLRLQMVATAEAALRISRTAAVDLWVVNTELPGLSGCELCSMLKSRPGRHQVHLVANEYSTAAEQAAWRSRATLFACKAAHLGWLRDWLRKGEHTSAPLPSATDS